MANLNGRRLIVTGAASGIGRATANRLRRDGASVFTVDRAGEADLKIDVTSAGAAEAIVTAAHTGMGAIDGLIPCAGICQFMTIEGHEDALWDQTMAVNVTAVFHLVRAALPALRVSGRGRIVLIGSIMSSFAASGLVAYAASKHAVLGMTRTMASEFGCYGITVNCVQPSIIETPMTAARLTQPDLAAFWRNKAALGRLGQPEDVADVIAFLVSDDARFVSGHGILIDGAAMQRP